MAEFVYFRYVLAVIAFYCMVVVYLTGSSFNVTILKMIDNNCTEKDPHPDTFCWSKETEELLVSSYFIGYMFQLPGGLLANLYGAYYVCGLGMLVTIILSFVTPIVAHNCDWRVLLVVRLVQGLGAAPTFPALSALWAHWAPKHEVSTLFSITAAGHFIGAALADALSGVLCNQSFILGGSWPSVFRIFGIIGILWFVLWVTFASSDPEHSIWTSLDEKDYIRLNRVPLRRNTSIPWLWILTSTKCWAIYFCHICSYFGYLTMLVGYPQYFNDVHKMKISDLGAVSAIPILSMFVASVLAGKITDMVLKRDLVTVTAIRKINTAIGMFIPAALNFVLAFCPKLPIMAVMVLMSLQNAANGFVLSGFQVNYIDINPDHAGLTSGVGNSLASTAGVIIPILLYRYNMQPKHLTDSEGGGVETEWKHMFISVGTVMTIGAIVYCIVGTGKRQMEGMEGYVEIAGTDSGAEQTTCGQTTSQNNSSSALVDVPDEMTSTQWPEEGAPCRASIDLSGLDMDTAQSRHLSAVQNVASNLKSDGERVEEVGDLIKLGGPTRIHDEEMRADEDEEKDDKDSALKRHDQNEQREGDVINTESTEGNKTLEMAEPVKINEVNGANLDQNTVAERRGLEIAPFLLISTEESTEINVLATRPALDISPEIKPAEEVKEIPQISTPGQDLASKAIPDQILIPSEISGQVLVHREITGQVSTHKDIIQGPPARRYTVHSTNTYTWKDRGEAMAKSTGKRRSQSNASELPRYIDNKPEKVSPVTDDHNSDRGESESETETGTGVYTEEAENSGTETGVYTEEAENSGTETGVYTEEAENSETETGVYTEEAENSGTETGVYTEEAENSGTPTKNDAVEYGDGVCDTDSAEFVEIELKSATEITDDEQGDDLPGKFSLDSMLANMM